MEPNSTPLTTPVSNEITMLRRVEEYRSSTTPRTSLPFSAYTSLNNFRSTQEYAVLDLLNEARQRPERNLFREINGSMLLYQASDRSLYVGPSESSLTTPRSGDVLRLPLDSSFTPTTMEGKSLVKLPDDRGTLFFWNRDFLRQRMLSIDELSTVKPGNTRTASQDHLSKPLNAAQFRTSLNEKSGSILNQIRYPLQYRKELEVGVTSSVISAKTVKLAELSHLFEHIKATRTTFGEATLYRSCLDPLTSLPLIKSRQEAVRAITNNVDLRTSIDSLLNMAKEEDAAFVSFISARFEKPQRDFHGTRRLIRRIVEISKTLPEVNSPYLQSLFEDLRALENSVAYRFATSMAQRTLRGVVPRADSYTLEPRIPFSGNGFSYEIWGSLGLAGLGAIAKSWFGLSTNLTDQIFSAAGSFGVGFGVLFGFGLKLLVDHHTGYGPIRTKMANCPIFQQAIDSLSRLDELLSIVDHNERRSEYVVEPNLTVGSSYQLSIEEFRNPTKAMDGVALIPNNILINAGKVLCVTGPNDVGKTTLVKGIAQNQILAHLGAMVFGKYATMTVVPRIFIQGPEYGSLSDEHGRYGMDLTAIKGLLFESPRGSLIVLDEFGEGTQPEEGRRKKRETLVGMKLKGIGVIWVTHDFSTVQRLGDASVADSIRGEILNEEPTKKLLPGIASTSLAERTAKAVGYGTEDIIAHLKETGDFDQEIWDRAVLEVPEPARQSPATPPKT